MNIARSRRFPRLLLLPVLAGFLLLGANRARAQAMQTYLMLRTDSQETLLVTDRAEQVKLLKGGWKTNGTAVLLMAARADTVPVRRMVRPLIAGNDRMFSINPAEVTRSLEGGYHDEGVLGHGGASQMSADMVPLYRFTKGARHLWLIDKSDQAWAEEKGWKADGIAFWMWPQGATP